MTNQEANELSILNYPQPNDSSADYWKLVQHGDRYMWERDNSDDFDLSLVGKGIVRSEDMTPEMAAKLGQQLYRDKIRPTFHKPGSRPDPEWLNFANGTMSFVGLNNAISTFINGFSDSNAGNINNINLGNVNSQLDLIEKSGLLARNDANLFTASSKYPDIIKGGVNNELFFALPLNSNDLPLITSPHAYRAAFWLDGMPQQFHPGTDFAGNIDPVISVGSGSLSLGYTDTYGFSAKNYLSNGGTDYLARMSHIMPESINNYIDVFATKGVTYSNGKLLNIPGGIQIGQVGDTGLGGRHSDFYMENLSNNLNYSRLDKYIDPVEFFDLDIFYKDSYSQNVGGYPNSLVTNDLIDGVYNQAPYETIKYEDWLHTKWSGLNEDQQDYALDYLNDDSFYEFMFTYPDDDIIYDEWWDR